MDLDASVLVMQDMGAPSIAPPLAAAVAVALLFADLASRRPRRHRHLPTAQTGTAPRT